MRDQLTIYRALVNENAPAFTGPITWHANGRRGHLHASSTCDKLRRGGNVRIDLDLRSALTDRKVCGECIGWGAYDQYQRDSVSIARTLLESLRNSEHAPQTSFKGRPAVTAAREHQYRSGIAANVRREQNLCGLDGWVQRVIDVIDGDTPPMPQIDALHEECILIAAPYVLQRQFSDFANDPGFWGGNEVLAILGSDQERSAYSSYRQKTPLVFFVGAWVEKLNEGLTPQEANSLLLGGGEIVNLLSDPDKQQLERCSVVLDRIDGETLWQFTARNWKAQTLEALSLAADVLASRHAALTAPAAPVLIGNGTQSPEAIRRQCIGTNVDQIVGSLQTLVGNSERTVAVCHPTVAQFLVGNHNYGSWSGPVTIDGAIADDELETTVALWEPRNRYSSYEKLSAAFEAARAL